VKQPGVAAILAALAAVTAERVPAQITSVSLAAPSKSDSLATKQPFSFADFTWLNGNSRQKYSVLDTKPFTGELRADVSYIAQFNRPKDHRLVGTSESGRTSEVQLQQLGIGGDLGCALSIARFDARP